MAYNNGFPMGYSQYYPQYAQPNTPAQNNSIIWVQGKVGANAYLVAPNTTVQLWDSENPVIYLKSADASGMPSIKILDYTVRETSPQNVTPISPAQNKNDYVTREELHALEEKIEKQINKLSLVEEVVE